MLRITKLSNAEYLIGQVVLGIGEYYAGVGEAPGVWQGHLADQLGLSGVVDADQLRALLLGRHPATDAELLSGHMPRSSISGRAPTAASPPLTRRPSTSGAKPRPWTICSSRAACSATSTT